jgi:hypothetical protein
MRLHTVFSGRLATPLALAACLVWAGCSGSEETPTEVSHGAGGPGGESHAAAGEDHDDHDHSGHDHAEMGSHGGHIAVLDPGHIHAEWVHVDDEEMLEVYILDDVEVTAVKVISQVKDADPTTVDLTPIEGEEPRGYSVKNPNVLTNISMADGETVRVTLVVETPDGELKTELTDDHDHDH